MISSELSDYISKARGQGLNDDQISTNLKNEGWREEDIREGLSGSAVDHSSSQYPSRLLGVTELLQAAWERFKSRWKTALIIYGIPLLLTSLPMIVILLLGMNNNNSESIPSPLQMTQTGIASVLVLPFVLVGALLSVWAQVALYYLMSTSPTVSWKEAYIRSKGLIWPYFVLSFLIGFITLAGFALFFVPGIILSIMLFAAYPVLIQENVRGFDALTKSRWYAEGLKLELFKRFLLIFLIGIGFLIVVSILGAIPVIGNLATFAVQLILTPFAVALSMVLYENVKAIKGTSPHSPAKSSSRYFLYWFIGGLLVIPLLIALSVTAIFSAFNNYIYDEKQGDTYEEGFEQYLPEDYEQQLENTDLMQEEQMRELERMMQEYGMTPLPRNQDGTDPNELI